MRYAAHLVAALVVVVASADGFAQVQNSRGYLGLMLDDRPWNIGGVPVMRVHPRTPADVAGFQVGDIVISCNGAPSASSPTSPARFIKFPLAAQR